MTFDFFKFIMFVKNVTRFLFLLNSTLLFRDMFVSLYVNNNTVFSINLSTLTKCALFTYKPVVPNCI